MREVYRELQNQTAKIFEPKGSFTVSDLADLNLDTAVLDIFTTTPIQVKKEDGTCSQVINDAFDRGALLGGGIVLDCNLKAEI